MNRDQFVLGGFVSLRGGSWYYTSGTLLSSYRLGIDPIYTAYDSNGVIGFRVASVVPEPSTAVLAALAFAGLAALGWRRRKRA